MGHLDNIAYSVAGSQYLQMNTEQVQVWSASHPLRSLTWLRVASRSSHCRNTGSGSLVMRIVRCGQLGFDQLMILHLATNENKHGTMKDHAIGGLSSGYSTQSSTLLQRQRENEKLGNK